MKYNSEFRECGSRDLLFDDYLLPHLSFLSSCRVGFPQGSFSPGGFLRKPLVHRMIVLNQQMISFLGLRLYNGELIKRERIPPEIKKTNTYLDAQDLGGRFVETDQLSNIQRTLLTRMLSQSERLQSYYDAAAELEEFHDIFYKKGGLDFVLLLIKRNLYDIVGREMPIAPWRNADKD